MSMGPGANLVYWDGRDRDGDAATEGLYLVTVEALDETRTLNARGGAVAAPRGAGDAQRSLTSVLAKRPSAVVSRA